MELSEIRKEVDRSRELHGDFKGAHEGYAVLLEEVDELWDHVKKKDRLFRSMRTEALQIAAMAVKFIEDVCEKENGR